MRPRKDRSDRLHRLLNPFWGAVLVCLFSLAAPSLAQETPASETDQATEVTRVGRAERTLASFTDAFKEARLMGTKSEVYFDIPLPARWRPLELRLDLVYRHSINLLEAHSQLRVELNGLIIAQLKLDPARPEGRAQIRLPLELLQTGYNRLAFSVAQHTLVGECEDPGAPELWIQIDTQASRLILDYERTPVAASLEQLDVLFDPRLWTQETWPILMPVSTEGASRLDDTQLRWGALIAQGIGKRFEFQPPRIESVLLGSRPLPSLARLAAEEGRDLILVGTRDQLRPILGEGWAAAVEDGYLALLPYPADETRAVLVISGRTPEEVERAATAFAVIEEPFPEGLEVLVRDLELPDLPKGAGPAFIAGGARARFADLGVGTTTLYSPIAPARWYTEPGFAGPGSEVWPAQRSLRVRFWVQPGFYVEGLKDAILRLNFSYGAGFRRDSVLNVLINGLFVRAIPLNDPLGVTLLDYKLRIPAGMLRSGPNQLEILPMLVPAETGWCQLRQAENLLLTVYGDSTLELPPMTQFARLPDLELWARTGFPSLRDPEGSELAVEVAGATPEAAGAAWTLLARLAQISGVPLYRAEIGSGLDLKEREALVIGALPDLDPTLKAASPWRLSDTQSFVDYGSLRTIAEAERGGEWWERSLARIQDWFETQIARPQDHSVRVLYADQILRRAGILTAFESPFSKGRTLVMLTANRPDLLVERTAQLVQPDYWFNVRGALVLWGDRPQGLRWQPPQRVYLAGEGPVGARLSFVFSQYPQALLAILAALAVILALILTVLIRAFKRRHHPLVPDED